MTVNTKTVTNKRAGKDIRTVQLNKTTEEKLVLASYKLGNKKMVNGHRTGTNKPVHIIDENGNLIVGNSNTTLISAIDAEYLYLTNGYIARGVDTEAGAIIRNGVEIIASNPTDQKRLDNILQKNDFDIFIEDVARYTSLYGTQFVEVHDSPNGDGVQFTILPQPEMDYLRDGNWFIKYNKDGTPAGYTQKNEGYMPQNEDTTTYNNGMFAAVWDNDDAKRVVEFKYKTLSGAIEGISTIQNCVPSAIEYGFLRGSLSDSFVRNLPVMHVTVNGATVDDLEEATDAVSDKFTARTVYVTSERYTMESKEPRNVVNPKSYIEPSLSEIAACFHMPIEMIAATDDLKSTGNDFEARYAEWIAHIKMKQRKMAAILENKLFPLIFKEPIKVKFNSPLTPKITDLINVVSFARQSEALTPEQAFEILNKNQCFGPYSTVQPSKLQKVIGNGETV